MNSNFQRPFDSNLKNLIVELILLQRSMKPPFSVRFLVGPQSSIMISSATQVPVSKTRQVRPSYIEMINIICLEFLE